MGLLSGCSAAPDGPWQGNIGPGTGAATETVASQGTATSTPPDGASTPSAPSAAPGAAPSASSSGGAITSDSSGAASSSPAGTSVGPNSDGASDVPNEAEPDATNSEGESAPDTSGAASDSATEADVPSDASGVDSTDDVSADDDSTTDDSMSDAPAPPTLPPACPSGSEIAALFDDALAARYGTVFGDSLYYDDHADSYNPLPLQVQVVLDGEPVAHCVVTWSAPTGQGWLFAEASQTDADGIASAYWTAGTAAEQTATASIAWDTGERREAQFKGLAYPSDETRANSVHFTTYSDDTYTEFAVRVTPLTAPPSTYYETQGWIGAYGGVQFDDDGTQVLFSVWDTDGKSSEIRDPGACNTLVQFGGEGTGTSCRLTLPPSEHGAIVGLPDDYNLVAGDTYETHLVVTYPDDCDGACTDYTFTFTDVTRGLGPISLGTQRYMDRADNHYNDSFIEDWWSEAGDDCIGAGARTAYFHDLRAKVNGEWQAIEEGDFRPNFVPTNHEICANYDAYAVGQKFLISTGGSDHVGAPLFDEERSVSLQ